jgi:hypothetical protein
MPGPRKKTRRGVHTAQPVSRTTKKPVAKEKPMVKETARGFLLRTFKLEKL